MSQQKLSQMKIEVDTHTHTVLSGHAWSTLQENAIAAAQVGLKKFVCTEHAYKLPGSTAWFLPFTFKDLPTELMGVGLVMGMEFNILDYIGSLDLKEEYRSSIRFGIASMHDLVIHPGTATQNTDAFIGALADRSIDILGHPGNPYYPIHIEDVVLAAKRTGKMIEINNHSARARKGSHDNCVAFARLCKKHGVRVCASSDAHICTSIGHVEGSLALLDEVEFPAELVVNLTVERFDAYLAEHAKRHDSL